MIVLHNVRTLQDAGDSAAQNEISKKRVAVADEGKPSTKVMNVKAVGCCISNWCLLLLEFLPKTF